MAIPSRAANGGEYRIFGIDAPELHQTCKEANGKSWACGRAAKARLTVLMKGGNVTCEERAKDHYGRIVAVCSAEGVPDLGETLVRQGYAIDLGGAIGNPYIGPKPRPAPRSAEYGAAPSSAPPIGGRRTRERIEAERLRFEDERGQNASKPKAASMRPLGWSGYAALA